jgi:hypothetical protein
MIQSNQNRKKDIMTKHTRANNIRPTPRDDKTRTNATTRRDSDIDVQLENLMRRLYFSAKCGNAAAEYNLEKAGVIEMTQGHAAGQMQMGDNHWGDYRWDLTELGNRTKLTDLERIILRDPPLEIALRDAEYEAADVAERCRDPECFGYVTLHKRILSHLDERAERIRAAQNLGL